MIYNTVVCLKPMIFTKIYLGQDTRRVVLLKFLIGKSTLKLYCRINRVIFQPPDLSISTRLIDERVAGMQAMIVSNF